MRTTPFFPNISLPLKARNKNGYVCTGMEGQYNINQWSLGKALGSLRMWLKPT